MKPWKDDKRKHYGTYAIENTFRQTSVFDNINDALDAAESMADNMIKTNIQNPFHITGFGYVTAGPDQYIGLVIYK